MSGGGRLFIGIVVALLGSCGGTDDPPRFAGDSDAPRLAELIPIEDARPAPASPPNAPMPPSAAPCAEAKPSPSDPHRPRVRVRRPRRPIREPWITGGSDFSHRPMTAARRASLGKFPPPLPDDVPLPARPQHHAPILRAAPRW